MISDRNQGTSQPQTISSSASSVNNGSIGNNGGNPQQNGGWPSSMTGYSQLNGFNSLMGPSLIMGSGGGGGGGGGPSGGLMGHNYYPGGMNGGGGGGGGQFNPTIGSYQIFTPSSIGSNVVSRTDQGLTSHNSSNSSNSLTIGGNQVNNGSNPSQNNSLSCNFDQAVKYAAEANHKANVDKDYYEAIKLYGEAISMDGSDHRFYLNRSYCYAQLELYQLALDDAIQAIALNPNLAKCYFRKGQALAGLKKYKDAERSFLEVLRLEPECQETRHELTQTKAAALSMAGFDDKIAHWAANKFQTIDEALNNLYSLLNNPATAGIINNPSAAAAGLINSSSDRGSGLRDGNSMMRDMSGGSGGNIIGNRPSNPWDPTPGSAPSSSASFGVPGGNYQQNSSNSSSQYLTNAPKASTPSSSVGVSNQLSALINQKLSDNSALRMCAASDNLIGGNNAYGSGGGGGYNGVNVGNNGVLDGMMINRSRDQLFGVAPNSASDINNQANSVNSAHNPNNIISNGIGSKLGLLRATIS